VAQASFAMDDMSELTPNTYTQAGNAFVGKQSTAKKAKGPDKWLAAGLTNILRKFTQHLIGVHHSTCHCSVPDLCLQSMSSVHVEPVFARCEFDTHADTCALWQKFVPLSYTGRVCDLTPYNAERGKVEQNVPIITGSTVYFTGRWSNLHPYC
jgi:hypothetical protein